MTENRYTESKTIQRAIQEAKDNVQAKLEYETRTLTKTTARTIALDTIKIITDGLKSAELEEKIEKARKVRD